MPILTDIQVAQLALNAGVPQGQPLFIAVCIAKAESGNNTTAVNTNTDGTKDIGLWQINDVHSNLWPTGDQRTDPNANAQYMNSISAGGVNWQPWQTYTNGAYMQFMNTVMSEIQQANLTRGTGPTLIPPSTQGAGTGSATATTQVLNIPGLSSFEQLWSIMDKFFKFLTSPDGWIRILKVGIGGLLILIGAFLLMRSELPSSATIAKAAALA